MSANLFLTILQYEAESSDIELEITKLSQSKILKHKQSSSKVSEIHSKYTEEKDVIRNKIKSLDTKESTDEYKALMADLNEIKDNEEQEVQTEEDASTDYENSIQLQLDMLQTRKQAVDSDLEGFKEANNDDIKKTYGYFNNSAS